MNDLEMDKVATLTRRGDTVDVLHSRLRELIQTGQLAPGQRLIEADLTKEFGVSRGPLREALRRLGAEGIVEFIPNKGAQIRKFSRKEVLDLFLLRQVLEGLAVRTATLSLQIPEKRLQLMRALDEIENARENFQNFAHENSTFHGTIVELADNPQLGMLLNQLQLPLVRFQIRGAVDRKYIEQSRREHHAIALAMLNNDPAGAEHLMQQHLQLACDRLVAVKGLFPS